MSSMPGLPPHPYVPPPPPRRNYLAGCMLFAAGTFAVVTVLVGVAGWLLRGDAPGLPTFSQRIGVVELEGEIDDTRDLVEQLDRYGDDSSVRAVVLRINSPGGAVAPSQEMLEAVRRLRDKEKPVVVSMGEVCASGGYYIASGADTIFANPGTLTASIGVIWSFPTAEDLLKKVGVRWEIVKSGKVKDVGSPFQSLKPEGRAVLQALSDDT